MLLGLGAEPKELTFLQVSLRGIVVFFAALVMVRLASKRSFADKTAFDGRRLRKSMRINDISEHDLEEDMRLNAATEDLSKIKVARIERSGDISFIKTE